MQIYWNEIGIIDGFQILSSPDKHDRLVRGRRVDRPSGWNLFKSMEHQPIKCWCCGIEADRWVVSKGRKDHVGHPGLNLFAPNKTGIVLMTRDHIIPKSLGGIDANANLRPGCAVCNEERSNSITAEDVAWAKRHPELIDPVRVARGVETLARALSRLRHDQHHERARIQDPFIMMGYV